MITKRQHQADPESTGDKLDQKRLKRKNPKRR